MEKGEIIRLFIKKGVVLSPDVIEELSKNDDLLPMLDEYLEKNKTVKFVNKKILSSIKRHDKKIILIENTPCEKMSSDDVIRMLRNRFDFLSNLIKERKVFKNIISIKNIKKHRSKKFSIIGMVKDISENRITVEDYTGTVSVFVDNKQAESILLDDVVGMTIINTDGMYVVDKIVYPEISIFRKPNKCDTDVFVCKNKIITKDGKTSFDVDDIKWIKVGKITIVIINKSILEHYDGQSEVDLLISLLKKRNFNPTLLFNKKFYKNDPFLIKEVPDFVLTFGCKETSVKSYKGVVVASISEDQCIDLKSKKTIKFNELKN